MENSHIQWTGHTFNPWIGCTKVSPGCAHCYAEARDLRFSGGEHWGKGAPRQRTSTENWKGPRRWHRQAEDIWICDCGFRENYVSTPIPCPKCKTGTPRRWRPRVFCASLADWLDEEVPIEWLADLLKLIHDTPNLDWLLLTKRPENWQDRLCEAMVCIDYDWIEGRQEVRSPVSQWVGSWIEATAPHRGMASVPSNVWLGTTVEDQQRADERIPALLKIPACVRFLSCEPLLEEVDLEMGLEPFQPLSPDLSRQPAPISWVIFGGESNGRACNIEWIYSGVQQCHRAGVKCFVKQLGSNAQTGNANLYDWPESTRLVESPCIEGAAAAGICTVHRKGGDWNEWPDQLRVREFPNSALRAPHSALP
jgi:protein gp37